MRNIGCNVNVASRQRLLPFSSTYYFLRLNNTAQLVLELNPARCVDESLRKELFKVKPKRLPSETVLGVLH